MGRGLLGAGKWTLLFSAHSLSPKRDTVLFLAPWTPRGVPRNCAPFCLTFRFVGDVRALCLCQEAGEDRRGVPAFLYSFTDLVIHTSYPSTWEAEAR